MSIYKHNKIFCGGILIFLLSLSAGSIVSAEVYKWRDSRGIVQYSDQPPAKARVKPTQKLIRAVLDTQATCSTKPSAKNSGAAKLFEMNFFGIPLTSSFGFGQLRTTPVAAAASRTSPGVGFFGLGVGSSGWNIGAWARPKPSLPLAQVKPAPQVKPLPLASVPAVLAQPSPPIVLAAVTSVPLPAAPPVTSPATANLLPFINANLTPFPKVGASLPMLENMATPGLSVEGGVFRSICDFSHMSNDDPIIFPGLPSATHHHTFFGNTSIKADSNLMNLVNTGNSTCAGGTLNRTGYWVPTMVDTKVGKALRPVDVVLYYKVGGVVPRQYMTAPPLGLRMVAGNSRATSPSADNAPDNSSFRCFTNLHPTTISTRDIPACLGTGTLRADIKFPQCWDGKNLDSPDHKSHMAYENINYDTLNKCPTSHPVAIPKITILVDYVVNTSKETSSWRLASDNYPLDKPSGYSYHGDWVNGWDPAVMDKIVNNCLKKGLECNEHLGNGTGLSKNAVYTN